MSRGWAAAAGFARLLAACLCLGHGACSAERHGPAPEDLPLTAVEVLSPAEEEVRVVRRVAGDVRPWSEIALSFHVGGRVARVLVDDGDRVRAGQIVATIDPRDYRLQRELARTQIEALAPHLERAERLERVEAVPAATVDEIRGRMDVARVQERQARSLVSHTALRSPMDGVVVKRLVSAGDMVDPSRPVLWVADLRRVRIVLPVAQRDLPLFREGAKASVTAPGADGTIPAEILSVGYAADPVTRAFPVTLLADNESLALRAGMIVDAEIPVETARGVFLPLGVVSRTADGRPRVLVADRESGRAVSREVTLGALVGGRIQVTGGLAADDRVIVHGAVEEGDRVRVLEAGAPKSERRRP